MDSQHVAAACNRITDLWWWCNAWIACQNGEILQGTWYDIFHIICTVHSAFHSKLLPHFEEISTKQSTFLLFNSLCSFEFTYFTGPDGNTFKANWWNWLICDLCSKTMQNNINLNTFPTFPDFVQMNISLLIFVIHLFFAIQCFRFYFFIFFFKKEWE